MAWNGRMTDANRDRFFVTPRLIVGLSIALFGVLLIFDRMNLALAAEILRFWPAVIVAVGALIFAQSRHVGGGINGIIVMVIGGWMLLNTLGIVSVGFWELFWPMMLILIGGALVFQTLRRRGDESAEGLEDTLSAFAVLSGVKRVNRSARFRGGEVTLFMAGGQVDLRQASIPRGEQAVLDIFVVMGGCELLVPPSWTVEIPLVPVMGGVDDKRPSALPSGVTAAAGDLAAPRLILRGFLMMGGIEIKN
jgi:hypothetical protein